NRRPAPARRDGRSRIAGGYRALAGRAVPTPRIPPETRMANALRANESTVRPRERAYARCCRERDGACRSTSQRRAASPTTAGARPAPIRSGYRDRSEQEAEPPGTIRKPRRVRLRRVRVAWVFLLNPTPRGKFRAVKSLFWFF